MRAAVIGGGVLGLTLAFRLARAGHRVDLFEAAPSFGGLARPFDYGPFTWDAFYHCILPHDAHLVALLGELGLADQLRWRATGTGYFAGGRTYDMNGNRDFLRFPLLSTVDKLRLGAAVVFASRFADPYRLYRVTAAEWLTRLCGRRGYDVFWRPLLRAKFGPYHDRVAAVFIWATLTRLLGARRGGAHREQLGYVRGGYRAILDRFVSRLAQAGVALHANAPVRAISPGPAGGCRVRVGHEGSETDALFDQVFFTGPTALARQVADPAFQPYVQRVADENPTSAHYLGVISCNLVLDRPLTPYYVLNIGDSSIPLTGLVEMTNLVDREETAGHALVYLPRYLDSGDPAFEESDDRLLASFDVGLRRLFPALAPGAIRGRFIQRARFVQPLPLVRAEAERPRPATRLEPPFQVLNTSYLRCATLNNNEVVGLVNDFVAANPSLSA